jgi:hypothetical protein
MKAATNERTILHEQTQRGRASRPARRPEDKVVLRPVAPALEEVEEEMARADVDVAGVCTVRGALGCAVADVCFLRAYTMVREARMRQVCVLVEGERGGVQLRGDSLRALRGGERIGERDLEGSAGRASPHKSGEQ